MTYHPPPLAPTLCICMFSPYVVLNRFSTAVCGILPQNCAMRQWDKANHFRTVRLRIVFWILLWIIGLKLWVIYCDTTLDFAWLSHDQHEQNLERKLLVSLALLDLFYCHVFLMFVMWSNRAVILVCRYLYNFHVCWGSPGTSFWLKMSLHLNVINYYRGDTTSVSYICFITRHLLFETLDTTMFC